MKPSRRYALLALLANHQGSGGQLGKKAAQKFVHILTSLSKKNFGYSFSFYTYGAFSKELASDLDLAQSMGYVKVDYNAFDNAYQIYEGPKSKLLIEQEFSKNDISQIESVWGLFGGRTARDLELISTIFFVHDAEGLAYDGNKMLDRILELKPKYGREEVKAAQIEVKQKSAVLGRAG